ncbi:hypothetical protein KTI26_12760, partial [Acinetobacter ursingii]
TTYPSYALNLTQLGALCISNLCATKPYTTTEANKLHPTISAVETIVIFFKIKLRNAPTNYKK